MFRITILLLISTMLTCPLRCSAGETALGGEVGAAVSGCGCCTESTPAPGERSGQHPDQGCECGDCFCNGAVLESSADLLSAAIVDSTAALLVPSFDLGGRPVALASATDTTSDCGTYASGRAVRIAHQSLLI